MSRSVLLLALSCALSACSSGDATPEEPREARAIESAEEAADTLPSRRFHFSVEATIPAPEGTNALDVWVPLPMDDPGVQEVFDLETSTDGDASRGRRTVDPVHGNRMYHVRIENPAAETTVRWSADIRRLADHGQGRGPTREVHLLPNLLVPLTGEASEHARRLDVVDDTRPVAVRAKAIYDDVLDAMAYDKSIPGYGFGDFDRSMTVCRGNCTDFHARFTGVGRAAKIPVRFTMGIPMKPAPSGTYRSYHCWAHWHDGEHWQPVDISEADKIAASDPLGAEKFFGHLGRDRVALTFGRDIVLEPKQAAPPLNYFVFPYAEADGKPVALDAENWIFSWDVSGTR